MGHFRNKLWVNLDLDILETILFYFILLSHSRWPVYEITVAPSLKRPGILWKRLRNINMNDSDNLKSSRHSRVSTLKN